MESNFNPEFMQSWAGVCESLLLFARHATPEMFQEIVRKLIKQEADYSVHHLLHDICYKEDAEYFKNNLGKMRKIAKDVDGFYGLEKMRPIPDKPELTSLSYIVEAEDPVEGTAPVNAMFFFNKFKWY